MARLLALLSMALLFSLAACGANNDETAIRAVVERSNHEQEDAFAAHDPTLMQDSFTAQGFAYMVRTNEVLEQEGAVGIRLLQLEWGNVDVQSATQASAQTWETWEETDQDGNTVSSRDRNIYKLVKVGNTWKINELSYPDKPEEPSDQPNGSPFGPPPAG
jgi:hypothetical protein